jgi:DNA polymerase-3 subunit gamma/tau
MSWYRQYRPSTIAGLHAVAVKEQLEKLRQAKNFPHALLLTGPRGAGKTSTARILAAMLNEPTNELGKPLKDANPKDELVQRIAQGTSLVVHELDAASHRGIDDVRALKEQAYIPPQEGKVSVFILDEVHMLTTEAFNALLKLLEEPPQNVVFILATTEEQKVPATIVSRCTVVRFRKATPAEIGTALSDIVKDQKLDIDQEALQAIATAADGSFRDAVKTLETVSAGTKHITL